MNESTLQNKQSNINLKSETNGQFWDTVMHMRVASDGYSGRPQPRTLFLGPGTKIAHGAVAAKFSVNDSSGTENSPQL